MVCEDPWRTPTLYSAKTGRHIVKGMIGAPALASSFSFATRLVREDD